MRMRGCPAPKFSERRGTRTPCTVAVSRPPEFRLDRLNRRRESVLARTLVMRGLDGHAIHLDAQRTFELHYFRPLVPRKNRGCDAAAACAAGTTGSMDEVLRPFRHIVIDDV